MKNISIIALLFVVALGACKKDDSTNPVVVPPTVAKRLTAFTYDDNYSDPISIKYDSKGRVTEYNEGDDITTNTYTANEVHIVEFRKSENREVFNFKGILNAQGNIVSGTGISTYNSSSPQLVEYTFEYNPAGYLTRKTRVVNNGAQEIVTYYTYSNGNQTSFKDYVDGVYDHGADLEYDNNKIDKSGLSDNFSSSNTFCGKANKNMLIKYTANSPGSSGWFANFSYTMDADGYAKTGTTTLSNGTSYKYSYKFE